MNARQARELEGAISRRVPGGEVTVTPDRDGARVVIEANGESHRYDVGDGPSVLLNQLVSAFAD